MSKPSTLAQLNIVHESLKALAEESSDITVSAWLTFAAGFVGAAISRLEVYRGHKLSPHKVQHYLTPAGEEAIAQPE